MAWKSGCKSVPGLGGIGARRARLRHRVEHGKLQLRFLGVEVDEKIVNLVEHFLRARVGTIDFVDDHDRRQLGLKRLGEHIARLRQWPFGRVHQQHHAVDHLQRAFHFAAKIGVARRVHDVDLAAGEVDGGVLGENRDATLALEFIGVHHALGHLLVGAKGSRLAQHGVDEGGLSMVHMGDDGDIAYRLAQNFRFSFSFGLAARAIGLVRGVKMRRTARLHPFYQPRLFAGSCASSMDIAVSRPHFHVLRSKGYTSGVYENRRSPPPASIVLPPACPVGPRLGRFARCLRALLLFCTAVHARAGRSFRRAFADLRDRCRRRTIDSSRRAFGRVAAGRCGMARQQRPRRRAHSRRHARRRHQAHRPCAHHALSRRPRRRRAGAGVAR